MMNLTDTPQRIISKIFELIDEGNLNQWIDFPIDTASQQFEVKPNFPFSHEIFHRTISDYIRHVYEHGLQVPRELSSSQAHAEAIFLLQKYRNAYSIGYDAAILDAADPNCNGAELIIANMTEIIKEIERDKYIRWVLNKFLVSLDWETKIKVVGLLFEKFKLSLPPEILECDPAQLVDHCHTLIFNQISTNKLLHKVTSSEPLF